MQVLLETKEQFEEGVWVIYERNILEVYDTEPPLVQGALGLGAPSPQNPKPAEGGDKDGRGDR
jgi:hypothetical protein